MSALSLLAFQNDADVYRDIMEKYGYTEDQLLARILKDWLESSGVEVLKGRSEI